MKIKEILKKVVASFLLFAIMLLPSAVMASGLENDELDVNGSNVETEKEDSVKNEIEENIEDEVKDDVEESDEDTNIKLEDDELDVDPDENKYIKDAKEIKLLTKIKFTGKLYRTFKCTSEEGKYSEQVAVVTEISHRNDGILGVSFTKEGKILSSFGYIKVEDSKVTKEGKLLSFDFKLTNEKEGARIEINEKPYEINKNTVIKLTNGGIQIDDEFIELKEGDIIKLLDVQGDFGLENAANSMIDRVEIAGEATFKIIANGFIVSGEVVLNEEKVEGEAEVTYEGEKVKVNLINATIEGKELNTSNLKSFLSNLIKKIINFIKEAVSKLLPF